MDNVKVADIKNDQWILHNGKDWEVCSKRVLNGLREYDTKIILQRENLDRKHLEKEQGTWEPGRATDWDIILVHSSQTLKLYLPVDERQFDWYKQND